MASSSIEAKGLLSGLFDFNFKTFITLKFIRIIYVLEVIGIFIGSLAYFVLLIKAGGTFGILAAIILVPVGTVFTLIYARIMTEVVALFFRIGENTSILAEVANRSVIKTTGND